VDADRNTLSNRLILNPESDEMQLTQRRIGSCRSMRKLSVTAQRHIRSLCWYEWRDSVTYLSVINYVHFIILHCITVWQLTMMWCSWSLMLLSGSCWRSYESHEGAPCAASSRPCNCQSPSAECESLGQAAASASCTEPAVNRTWSSAHNVHNVMAGVVSVVFMVANHYVARWRNG